MLGEPEYWIAEHQRRDDLEYFDDNTGLPLEKTKVLKAREDQLVGLCMKKIPGLCVTLKMQEMIRHGLKHHSEFGGSI